MNDFFCDAQLSTNILTTPEGFLVCLGVPITRAGDFYYGRDEIPSMQNGTNPYVTLTRSLEDIHSEETAASFEGKPVTIGHPMDASGNDVFVSPANWKNYTVGVMQNVRPGSGQDYDKLLADLLITDAEAITLIKNNTLRQVSCGYSYDLVKIDNNYGSQKNIVGNHLALVEAGRAGPECSIFDSKKTGVLMSFKEKIMGAFSKAVDEAINDDSKSLKEMAKDESSEKESIKTFDSKPLEDKIKSLENTVNSLVASLKAKDEDCEKDNKEENEEVDQDVISKAEILAPGIEPSKDIKSEALDKCYKSSFGKKIIDKVLCGQSFDKADKNILFNATAELISSERKNGLSSAADSFKQPRNTKVTAEVLNRMNKEYWEKQDKRG